VLQFWLRDKMREAHVPKLEGEIRRG